MAGDHEFARFLRIEAALTSEDIMAWQGECLSPTLDLGRMSVGRAEGAFSLPCHDVL